MTRLEEILHNAHTGDLFRTRCGKVVEIVGEQMAHKSGELLLDGFVGELDNLRKLYIFSYDYGNGTKHTYKTHTDGRNVNGQTDYDIVGKWHDKPATETEDKPATEHDSAQYDQMKAIYDCLLETWAKKNADYGNSFDKAIDKYGYVSAVIRIEDKFNRLNQLLFGGKESEVKSESINDTLRDMANYCAMLVRYRLEKEGEK